MAKEENITDPRIRNILQEIEGGQVLDVGCVQHDPSLRHNPNWLHQHLYDRADEVLGVDIDEEGIEVLQNEGYDVTIADAEVLDIDGKYDYIVAGELIEHLANKGRFLSAVKSRLADEGQLIITTPNPWCWARMKSLVREDGIPCNPEHTHYHDEQTLRQLLDRYDFSAEIRFIGPMSEGITRRLYRIPITQLKRLGATQLLAVAELNEK
jgi:2-polyprenyl-3-methyl-5-hydroxy-6-metoxy-1,4-benzoquinol methylase